MITIKADWKDKKEAKKAKIDGKICDKHTFRHMKFDGETVKAGDQEKLTLYLVKKAVEAGAKESKAK